MTSVTYDTPIAPPSRLLLMAEGRALWEAAASVAWWPLLRLAPRGDGHAVLVLPGLVASDASTGLLRRYLKYRNYDVHGWGQGRNLGPRPGVEKGMVDLLKKLADQSGQKVSVVGWSLGGVYARMLAASHTDEVRDVITLGSPFVGSGHATNAWRIYESVSGQNADDEQRWSQVRPTPSVPTTSIYSRTDGVVAWQGSIQSAQAGHAQTENIEVIASHIGIGVNPSALWAVADRLAQREGAWQAFQRPTLLGAQHLLYPKPQQG